MRRFVMVCVCSLLLPSLAAAQSQPLASDPDPNRDGAARGALVGALAVGSMVFAASRWCGEGCNDSPAGPIVGGAALFGAGLGTLIGYLADRDNRAASRPQLLLAASMGPQFIRSTDARGRTLAPGLAIGAFVSPQMSVRLEWSKPRKAFAQPVPAEIKANTVGSTRSNGVVAAVDWVHIVNNAAAVVGFHPRAHGRIRLGLLGGLGVQQRETLEYMGASACSGQGTADDPTRCVPLPGKYMLQRFQTPNMNLVMGVDADIAIVKGLAVVPSLRVDRSIAEGSGGSEWGVRPAVGVSWRF